MSYSKITKDDVILFLIDKMSDILSLNTNVSKNKYKVMFFDKLKKLKLLDIPIDYKQKNNLLTQFVQDEMIKALPSNNIIKHSNYMECIQQGEFSSIYKQYSCIDDCVYAVKKLDIEEDAKTTLQEIRIMSKLHHPNVVRYHTAWIQSNVFDDINPDSIVIHNDNKVKDINIMVQMELCKMNLKQYIEQCTSLSLQSKLKICYEIANGIEYIHNNKCVHMDIKPENILFGYDNKFKISDFGLSQFLPSQKQIQPTDAKGTIGYIAPEVMDLSLSSFESDIYSLGITFLYVFSSCHTMMEFESYIYRIRQSTQKEPVFSEKIDNLIKSMIQIESKQRPTIHYIKKSLFLLFN